MALTYSSASQMGSLAPGFSLPGVDGKVYTLSDFSQAKALVIIFMCNHCPYVVAVQDRINDLAKEYVSKGVRLIGISSNDVSHYPADSFENMRIRAREKGFVFPYLWDETQSVAKSYDAVCTPDPYLYENVEGRFLLRYRGRIDDNWKDERAVKRRDLAAAIDAVLKGEAISEEQHPSMGCNIKWK